mgnify:CR=1 FL=1
MIDHTSVRWTSRDGYQVAPDATRYEFWESSIAARAGLAAAISFCIEEVGTARIAQLARARAERLRDGLAAIEGVVIRDAPACFSLETASTLGASRCAHVTFEAESTLQVGAKTIQAALLDRKIATSVSPSGHTFDDQLWARPLVVRASPSYFITEEEVDTAIAAVRDILGSPPAKSRRCA